jgi:hypothetical protein
VSTELEHSRWFAGSRRPELAGVYERKEPDSGRRHFSYFNGKQWGLAAHSPDLALSRRVLSSVWQNLCWRGLAEQPKEPTNG